MTIPDTCDLCIVGAGVAGLNALHVASGYLPKGARVVLVDRKPRAGGMWTTAYDFVRLHQPHAMFTVGDLAWRPSHPRAYLATGAEVRDHLQACLDRTRGHFDLTELYGHAAETIEEDGAGAVVTLRGPDGAAHRLNATRVVNAPGFDVTPVDPLPLSSTQVVSTTPERLAAEAPGNGPVYIVGGGKTGMDTIQALMPSGRDIHLLNGKGTVFLNRNKMFPTGLRRWYKGRLQMTAIRDISTRYDGSNEDEVFAYFRENFSVSPTGGGEQFFLGILSEQEAADIGAALAETIPDYLQDVTDGPDGPMMHLRSGETRPVPPGATFVNCTGHLLRADPPPARLLSDNGAILSITSRAAIYFLSSASGYFATHLFFRDQLRTVPLYELDMDALLKQGRKTWYLHVVTHTFLNTMLLARTLPMNVMNGCGLDLDRWFPIPRRIAALVAMKRHERQSTAHCRANLDRLRERTGIRCQPIA